MTNDPAPFVDRFSERVKKWQEWYNQWDEYSKTGRGVPGDHFVLMRSGPASKLLREASEIMELQCQVNTMLLAAIDELNKKIGD